MPTHLPSQTWLHHNKPILLSLRFWICKPFSCRISCFVFFLLGGRGGIVFRPAHSNAQFLPRISTLEQTGRGRQAGKLGCVPQCSLPTPPLNPTPPRVASVYSINTAWLTVYTPNTGGGLSWLRWQCRLSWFGPLGYGFSWILGVWWGGEPKSPAFAKI